MTSDSLISDVVVDTNWVFENLANPSLAIVEVDTDLDSNYRKGHIPGAIGWDLHTHLEDQIRRDIPSATQIENLMRISGIGNDTTIVLYGDGNNRSATWAFWILEYFRHNNLLLMNGGRRKWCEENLPLSTKNHHRALTTYKARTPDKSLRAVMNYIVTNLNNPTVKTLDTRTLEEFEGKLTAAPRTPQPDIYRKGRIPGAIHLPWDYGAAEDGTFKPVKDLQSMYEGIGLNSSDEIIAYCRLGMRASYSWFILKHLLGFPKVRNYDGSWTEWGNSIGVPIE